MTLKEQLELHEGRKRFPYVDTAGKITIGIGRNLTDTGLSDDEIDYLFVNDVRKCDDVKRYAWFDRLNDVRQRVVTDMRFNLGEQGFRNLTRLNAALTEEDYHKAANTMRQYLWFKQVKSRGVRLATWMYHGEER